MGDLNLNPPFFWVTGMHETVVYSYKASGAIKKVCGKAKSQTKIFAVRKKITTVDFKPIIKWVGFGTVFEIENGTERIVAPWVKSGPQDRRVVA